ncbi:MAG: 3-(3-hydroxyphenyl)propionate hydroxylase [Hydrocarboniphaga sp.]|uniref:bifunctional 3-(3-hydroxy-phenyl)propionate/3-hydroxycinnamic acid hydroxylase n=1 Tax=Hydrocarboniphaga sp. TaxID=2033016 RepID=UPI00260AEF48|nr:bifunctional 3-(3-hydroxy-phenyl)propionate/3-hydroxycinnamic acid hydroxylase [Hydrocarboniphaga sp.]MDB5969999.1 3-(3-hydroxyphenyl)propionate hydroxylase [Hydrocarboniphaga sp.]
MKKLIPSEVDVLVVGYGPVGAAMGCLLGGYGVRTLVIDRAPAIFTAPRAIALDNEALRILQMVGLADDAFDKVVIQKVCMHSPYFGHFGTINTRGMIDDHPRQVTFFQPDLERALRNRAESQTSVTAVTSTELIDFQDLGDQVVARLKTVDGQLSNVSAKFIIGADGAGSAVRKAIGQEFTGQTYGEDWLIVDALNVPNNIDHIEFICDPHRPTPHMVAPGGRTRWEFMLNGSETREEVEKDESIRRLLAPWGDTKAMIIERKAVYRFAARSCERYSKGRAFLIGDAAHVTPPFAGQGLVGGLRDTANLSWKLAWVLRGHAAASILETYDQERRPHAIAMIDLAKKMGGVIMPRSRLKAVTIHGALRLLRLVPPVRKYLEDFGPKPKNEFSEGLFVAGVGKLRRGAMLPQFRVKNPQGSSHRSDDLIGSKMTLIGFGADVQSQLSGDSLRQWQERGGQVVNVRAAGDSNASTGIFYEVMDGEPLMTKVPAGWCAVIRPDRTILHDGEVVNAEQIVRDSLAALKAAA